MAKLPTKQSLGRVNTPRVSSIIATDRGAGAEGRGMAAVGRGISQLGAALASIGTQQQNFNIEANFQDFAHNQEVALNDAMTGLDPAQLDNFASSQTASYIENAKEFYKTVPENKKGLYEMKMANVERKLFKRASSFQRQQESSISIGRIGQMRDTIYSQRARQAGSMEDLSGVLSDFSSWVRSNPYISPAQKEEMLRKSLGSLEEQHLQRRIAAGEDPEEIKKDLFMPKDELDAYVKRRESRLQSQSMSKSQKLGNIEAKANHYVTPSQRPASDRIKDINFKAAPKQLNLKRINQDNLARVVETAEKLDFDPVLAAAIGHFESVGTFSTNIRPRSDRGKVVIGGKRYLSSAKGIFQFLKSNVQEFGYGDTPEAQMAGMVRKNKRETAYVEKRVGRELTRAERYLVHFQGPGAATKILGAIDSGKGNQALSKFVSGAAIQANNWTRGKTANSLMASINKKMGWRLKAFENMLYPKAVEGPPEEENQTEPTVQQVQTIDIDPQKETLKSIVDLESELQNKADPAEIRAEQRKLIEKAVKDGKVNPNLLKEPKITMVKVKPIGQDEGDLPAQAQGLQGGPTEEADQPISPGDLPGTVIEEAPRIKQEQPDPMKSGVLGVFDQERKMAERAVIDVQAEEVGNPLPAVQEKELKDTGRIRYRYLSLNARDRALKGLKQSLDGRRYEIKQALNDDLTRIREFGDSSPDFDEKMNLARRVLEPNQVNRHIRRRMEAKEEYEGLHDLDTLSNVELEQRLNELEPTADTGEGIGYKFKIYEKAERQARQIRQLRRKDPAQSVSDFDYVKQAESELRPNDPSTYQNLVMQRMRAQESIGIPPVLQQPITDYEASVIMAPAKGVNADQVGPEFEKIYKSLNQRYGQYADEVFKSALQFELRSKEKAAIGMEMLDEMMKDGQVKKATEQKAAAANEQETIDQALQSDEDDALRMRLENAPGHFFEAGVIEQQGQEFPTPNEQHIKQLKENPDMLGEFIRKFGPENAQKAMEQE